MTKYFLLIAVLVGCGESVEAPAETAPKARPTKKVEVEEPVPVADTYYYNPAGKRDPFQGSLNRKQQRRVVEVDEGRPPLQRWDVEKFTLRGVIFNTQMPRALLVDPDGIGHVVRVGTYVGRNWGKVSAISQEAVVVTEEYQTLEGELVVNPVQLRFSGAMSPL